MKYYVKLLGTPFRLDELKFALEPFGDDVIISDGNLTENSPVLYLFFANSCNDRTIDGTIDLAKLVHNLSIIPVIKNLADANEYIPDKLRQINAIQLRDSDPIDILKNYILSYFCLQNIKRKVFISYRRDDCEGLAQHLFNVLSKSNFIPFLDVYTIEPGVNFQQYLEQELSDSDIFICITSNNYFNSKWCKRELEIASEVGVGIIQLRFEGTLGGKEAAFAEVIQMGHLEDKSCKYDDRTDDIIKTVEKTLSICYELKRRNVESLFDRNFPGEEYKSYGDNIRYLPGRNTAVCLMNDIPDSLDLQKVEKKIEQHKICTGCRKCISFYGAYLTPKVADHHKWLNETNIPVKFNAL